MYAIIFVAVVLHVILVGALLSFLMKISPWVDTLAGRKKFAIFHAGTLVIAPIITALMIFTIKWTNSIGSVTIVSVSLNPFKDIGNWLLWSMLAWNFIGSLRFYDDAYNTGGSFWAKGVVIVFTIIFPFYYLYNLWYIVKSGLHPKI